MTERRSFIAMLSGILLLHPLRFFKRTMVNKEQNIDSAFFDIKNLEKELSQNTNRYLPFLNTKKLRTGLYVLPKGGTDNQQPHIHDEVYYVLSGKGKFKAGEDTTEVKEGAVLYVKAEVEHNFFDIEEELKILVFFSNME